jgi:hypothetical protein
MRYASGTLRERITLLLMMYLLDVCYARVSKNSGSTDLPNQEQSDTAIFLCQLLSNLYQTINVFRYDQKLKTLYIQAGVTDGIAIIIDENGDWNFVL